MKCIRILLLVAVVFTVAVLGSGCAAFRASTKTVDVKDEVHFDENFDYSDLRKITEGLAGDLLGSDFAREQEAKPVMMVAGVQNRTSEYVDTKNLTDRFRTILFKSKQFRFVNAARRDDLLKEQGYQAAHATPQSMAKVGQQLGARYMMSGSLTEMKKTSPRQVRVSTQKLNYYKLTMEVTDLSSGELIWTEEQEFARQASKPLIGW